MEIIRIPATRSLRKQRVAAYCRVSTASEIQEDSLEMQKKYYTDLIKERTDWEPVGVYADSRSGLSAEKRPQFMQMIDDALGGKIDRILCKSVSRFSRNAVECKRYIDLLRMNCVAVEFEKENLKTDDRTGTFVLSLMTIVAEQESRSISENIRMGYRARFARGEYKLGNNRILGYDTVDGKLVPNDDARVVKMIFEEFAAGKGIQQIRKDLENQDIVSRNGNIPCFGSIRYVLGNETYKGDKMLWKCMPLDLFTKKPDPSEKRDSIYLRNDHEAIVDEETWNKAQERLKEMDDLNKKVGHLGGKRSPLYGRIFCSKCGEPMVRKSNRTFHGVDYKVWVCRKRTSKDKANRCDMDLMKEDELCRLICKELGWESFDEGRFLKEVSRVNVGRKKLTIERK